ncbi:MAG: transposase [Aneurinibacillus aneurinilyticus]|jgi:transposase|nr:transposase [Aneurinibacillus aneurinilyticus]MCI1694297.1 transposase [Aneurinibacillus aneurinilyticus]
MAKKYSQEFKHQAVQLILEEGKTVAQAAHELGLHENTLYRWVTEVKKDGDQAYRRQRPQDEVLHHSTGAANMPHTSIRNVSRSMV